jgi:hypothetical protein
MLVHRTEASDTSVVALVDCQTSGACLRLGDTGGKDICDDGDSAEDKVQL